MKRTTVNYSDYIVSRDWYSKHSNWLKITGYRCTMFPWVRIGYDKRRYAIHHMRYANLGQEQIGRDVIPLCRFAHDYIIHGILSGFKSAGKQRGYPNLAQRLAHLWCIQRLWFKGVLVVSLVCWLCQIFL